MHLQNPALKTNKFLVTFRNTHKGKGQRLQARAHMQAVFLLLLSD